MCAFVYLLQLKYLAQYYLNVFFSRLAQPLSTISFCYFWMAVLSFLRNYFLLIT